jgi:hypothetical protein
VKEIHGIGPLPRGEEKLDFSALYKVLKDY